MNKMAQHIVSYLCLYGVTKTMFIVEIQSKLIRDKTGLLPISYMFSGFQCVNLMKSEYQLYNGFRITMKPPKVPVKFGAHFVTNLYEVEHFVAHILDDQNPSEEWVQYEIPVPLMINNQVKSRMIRHLDSFEDSFNMKALDLFIEKQFDQE